MNRNYDSSDWANQAKKLGSAIVEALAERGIKDSTCKLDREGHYGVFFKLDKDEVRVLTIENRQPGKFNPHDTCYLSIRYRTVYKFGGSSRPICNGFSLSKLPSVESIVNNLSLRHIKISVAHGQYVIACIKDSVFRLESQSLKKDFPHLKLSIVGEADEGHAIHFDKLSVDRARQILEVLTRHLPPQVGEDS